MACRQAYPAMTLRAVDNCPDTLQYLLRHDVAHHTSLTPPTTFAPDHLVILSAHLRQSLTLLETIAPSIPESGVLVSDAGSCKRAICARGAELLGARFIGGHPLAGKEFSGVRRATPLLFHHKPWALCPVSPISEDQEAAEDHKQRLAPLRRLLRDGLGAMIQEVDPERHDRAMAFVSHFPQLYAVLLANLLNRNQPGQLLGLHGAGLDDQLRLAASPYGLWRDVFDLNSDNLRDILGLFRQLCDEADPLLTQPAMATWFERANQAHQAFHQKPTPARGEPGAGD